MSGDSGLGSVLGGRAKRACDLGQACSGPRERRDPEAHHVIVVMLDHQGFLATFGVPGQRAVREAAAPGLIDGAHDTARRPGVAAIRSPG